MFASLSRYFSVASTLWLLIASIASSATDRGGFQPQNIITRDVLVIGGGAAGTYAAVQLKDRGKSVAVIERHDFLGGRATTLRLDNGDYIDYGVSSWFEDDVTKAFMNRLDVDWEPTTPYSNISERVDFTTGERVPPLDQMGLIPAALLYREALEQFEFLRDWTFTLPDPVPKILVAPFREFVEKYDLQPAVEVISGFAQQVGEILEAPAWLVIRDFGIPHINMVVGGSYIRPKNGIATLYEKASRALGADVLYRSKVTQITRSKAGVRAIVQHADGKRTLVKAKKLFLGIPPTLTNLEIFDLDERETDIFRKWQTLSFYVAVLNDTGLPDKTNVINNDPTNRPGGMPHLPFQWHLDYAGVEGHHITKLIAPAGYTCQQARDQIVADILRMCEAGTYNTRKPNLLKIGSHTPNTLHPSIADLQAGFYRDLYGLQGHRNTFYSGLAFVTDYTSPIWNYTSHVIDQMVL